MCQKEIPFAHGNALYCGNERKKTGCARKAFILRNKKWKKKIQYHKTSHRLKKMREYSRAYYLRKKARKVI